MGKPKKKAQGQMGCAQNPPGESWGGTPYGHIGRGSCPYSYQF